MTTILYQSHGVIYRWGSIKLELRVDQSLRLKGKRILLRQYTIFRNSKFKLQICPTYHIFENTFLCTILTGLQTMILLTINVHAGKRQCV